MLNLRLLLNQIEIAFWTLSIRLMHESKLLQALVERYYLIRSSLPSSPIRSKLLVRLFYISMAGWAIGFLVGLVSLVWID